MKFQIRNFMENNHHEFSNSKLRYHILVRGLVMDVWQGVAMDSLKFDPGPPCPILLSPASRTHLKGWAAHRGGLYTGQVACSHLLPL
jgi:hypothetical protein